MGGNKKVVFSFSLNKIIPNTVWICNNLINRQLLIKEEELCTTRNILSHCFSH